MEAFEYNQKKFYPEGSAEAVREKGQAASKKRKQAALDEDKTAGADKPGELGRFKRIVTRLRAGEIDAAQAKDEAKRERKAMTDESAEKDIRSAGYYAKVFGKVAAAAKAGEAEMAWVKSELKRLQMVGAAGKGKAGVVDVERKANILSSFI